MKTLLNFLKQSVYVVCATEYERVKDTKVFYSYKKAWKYYEHLRDIYGGANTAFISRKARF